MSTIGKSPILEHDTHYVFDSSKIRAFMDCPRGYFFRYVLGLESHRVSPHLAFGSAWHESMEHLLWHPGDISGAYDKFVQYYQAAISKDPFFEENRAKNPQTALSALAGYVAAYPLDYQYETLHTEIAGTVPINEDNQLIHVKIDSVLRDQAGLISSREHKTTGRDSASWRDKWNYSFQVATYSYFLWAWLDNPALFDGVTVNGAIFRTKDQDFRRIKVKHSMEWLESYVWTANYWIDQILHNMEQLAENDENDRIMYSFPINSASCEKFGCKFVGLCASRANPLQRCHSIPSGYSRAFWDPRTREVEAKTLVRLEEEGGSLL